MKRTTLSDLGIVLAPRGRDASVAVGLLKEAGVDAVASETLATLISALNDGAGFAVIAEEALSRVDISPLVQWLSEQEEWSDFPFILLTNRGGIERNPTAARFLGTLGNVTFLERPFHPTTLVSLAKAAIRARRRQYEARGRLVTLHTREAALLRSENSLREINETLETRVEARTAELLRTEDALRQAQKMEAVGQLTGGLAHDFNNMLAAISGAVQIIARRLSQNRFNDLDKYIDAALSATQRAASLTQKLLAFSRRQTLDPRPTEVNKLVSGMQELLRGSGGQNVELEIKQQDGLWNALVDATQLENSILNLCINARDAMAPTGGRITIQTTNEQLTGEGASRAKLAPGEYVAIRVSDTGVGMTPEVISHMFDPFYTTKPIGQGTGLGLSMVYGFALQSGGQAAVDSTVGKGTTMCLYLPRYEGSVDHPTPRAARELRPGSGEVVLVIDDEAPIRAMVADILTEMGYTVLQAGDGPSGLRVLETLSRIDLLITDIGLPNGMNGRQVADKAREKRPKLKVLFITGYAQNAVARDGQLEAGSAIMTKPFNMMEMAERVRDLITTQRI